MREMLEHVDSYEIGEWMAYERAFGPIGSDWSDAALMAIHSQLAVLNKMTGAAHFGENNPVQGDMPMLPKPSEFYLKSDEDPDGLTVDDDIDDYEEDETE